MPLSLLSSTGEGCAVCLEFSDTRYCGARSLFDAVGCDVCLCEAEELIDEVLMEKDVCAASVWCLHGSDSIDNEGNRVLPPC